MMRVLALAAALFAQEEKGEAYWKFKKGTSWTYDHSAGKVKQKVVVTTDGAGDEGLSFATKVHVEGEKEPQGHVSSVEPKKGFLEWSGVYWTGGQMADFVHTLRVLKFGAKKGDTWDGAGGDEAGKWAATCQGTVELKVPAGTYKSAVLVELKGKGGDWESSLKLWFVADVGLAKIEREGKGGFVSELREFIPGK